VIFTVDNSYLHFLRSAAVIRHDIATLKVVRHCFNVIVRKISGFLLIFFKNIFLHVVIKYRTYLGCVEQQMYQERYMRQHLAQHPQVGL